MRNQKRGFRARKTHLIVDNKPVPWSQNHTAFRDHYQTKQWYVRPGVEAKNETLRERPALHTQVAELGPFSQEELQTVLASLKKNKAPGPDGLPNELFQLLDHTAELALLDVYNEIRNKRDMPQEWLEARVVTIFKGKGSDTDPANYRPIALLNVVYKILAAMIQKRLAKHMDHSIRPLQFGFRAGKSTQNPLFILRRAMEWANNADRPLQLLFLDWKQAFDSLDHTAMIIALRRVGVPETELLLISRFYEQATFEVQDPKGDKAVGNFSSGIRQGCPVSPYLFVLVLSVIFQDVDNRLLMQGIPTNTWSPNHPHYDLEYADDTLLMSLTIPQMQSMLSALETEADFYGMALNATKTEALEDPRYVPTSTQVKYLGSMVTWDKPFDEAFPHRKALAEEAYKKLRLVWNSSMSKKSKLRVFQSVFIPVLLYGLDVFTLTTPLLERIDAFYFRFLRRIIKIPASYISRVTNHTVWAQANYPKKPSEFILKMEKKLILRTFKAPREDPMHNVLFASGFRDRINLQGRRRGRPTPTWLQVIPYRHYQVVTNHTAPQIFFSNIARHHPDGDSFVELAPMRARERARP